jgi:hypothetical protein
MVKKGIKITDPNLVNFHFTNTPSTSSAGQQHHHHGVGSNTGTSTTRPRSGSFNNNSSSNKHNHNKKNHHHHRTAEDRASSRKKISAQMFPLHSSPDHAFVISRCCGVSTQQTSNHTLQQSISQETSTGSSKNISNTNTITTTNYTFQGPDRPVSWESVRIVKCFTPITHTSVNNCDTDNENPPVAPAFIPCPICLDDNCVCPRITKCGHTFCYTCILYHIQTYNDKTTNPKCPCCSLPIYMNDLRPIQIIPIQSPATMSSSKHRWNESTAAVSTNTATTMRFMKLHRYKYCHTSYIPHPNEPRRLSPNAIPCHTIDNDAVYAKFNYLHVPTYQQLLQSNLNELLSSLRQQQQQQQQSHARRSMSMMEDMVFGLAIQSIQSQLNHNNPAINQQPYHSELQLQQQYSNVGSGFYTLQIPSLIYHHGRINNNHNGETEAENQNSPTAKQEHSPCHNIDHLDATTTLESVSTSWDYSNNNDGDNNNNNNNSKNNNNNTNETHRFPDPLQRQRDRGNSITSIQSCSTSNSHHKQDHQSNHLDAAKETIATMNGGSMYATDEEYILYQAYDGSLCFLSGFNMNCLRTEFATTITFTNNNSFDCSMEQLSIQNQIWDADNDPNGISNQNSPAASNQLQNHRATRPPLPDTVEGSIVDIERVLLTPEMRERRRFLSHIPLYSEVCFVEIDINHLLSSRTKHVYKKEFMKRQQTRLAREKAEQREDELLQQLEQEKINERKARIQRIDPMDDFFQPVIQVHDNFAEPNMLSEDFGPAISLNTATTASSVTTLPGISFSQACQSGELFPSLFAAPTEMNFPALGSSPPNQRTNMGKKKVSLPPHKSWSSSGTSVISNLIPTAASQEDAIPEMLSSPETGLVAPPAIGKKNKSKKIVLFSTGAHRNDYF